MKRFETLEQLNEAIEEGLYFDYIKEEIDNFLECNGSTIVENEDEQPDMTLTIELNDNNYEIGVTSLEIEKPVAIGNITYKDYRNYYFLY